MSSLCLASEGPECQDEMDHKCQIETFYHPEKSNTSVDQHIPVSAFRISSYDWNFEIPFEVKWKNSQFLSPGGGVSWGGGKSSIFKGSHDFPVELRGNQ